MKQAFKLFILSSVLIFNFAHAESIENENVLAHVVCKGNSGIQEIKVTLLRNTENKLSPYVKVSSDNSFSVFGAYNCTRNEVKGPAGTGYDLIQFSNCDDNNSMRIKYDAGMKHFRLTTEKMTGDISDFYIGGHFESTNCESLMWPEPRLHRMPPVHL